MARVKLGNIKKAAKILVFGPEGPSTEGLSQPAAGLAETTGHVRPLLDRFTHAAEGLAQEAAMGPQLHDEAMAALHRMIELDESLKKSIDEAYGYAIFPSVARAALVLGMTFGKGEVLKKGEVIGYAGIVQITVGLQVTGETVHILALLEDDKALERLKSGKTAFAANAALGLVKTGVTAMKAPYGLRVFMYPEGGTVLEAAIGGQTIKFVDAALGRLRTAG